jgi:RHS repeat-associated protein
LSAVDDYAYPVSQVDLPDFDNGDNSGADYEYDDNGNLIKDLNKKIEKIKYNRLNLPSEVIFTGKGKITYSYTTAGAKLTKTVEEVGKPTKIMTYANGFLYENGELKEFGTAEGRMVAPQPPTGGVSSSGKGFLYQYHYKDHLGNVRMTFAPDVPMIETLRLGAELDSAKKEEKDFRNLVVVRTSEKALAGEKAAKITENQAVSSRVVRVQKGGSLALSAFATFDKSETTLAMAGGSPVEDLAKRSKSAALLAGAAAALSVQDVNIGGESKSKVLNFNVLATLPLLKNLFSKAKNKHTIRVPLQPEKPKAYIEIAVYGDSLQAELLSSKKIAISEKGEYFWENLQDSLVFESDGFAVVSLRNESEKEVLFDELNVRVYGTEKAVIIQENHYEPFGMTLKGLDYVLNPQQKNQFLFNGKELDESLDLQLYDYHARQVDPQTGRMTQVDPLADKFMSLSSYSYCANNPIMLIDPNGKEFTENAWRWVNRLINDINSRQERNNGSISEKESELKQEGLSERRTRQLNRQIERLKDENGQLETTRGEIATLEGSNQKYDVEETSALNEEGAVPGMGTTVAQTTFDANSKSVVIRISNGAGLGLFAHELKHAYQFDIGQTSLSYGGVAVPLFLHDKQDEVEGYMRQSLFYSNEPGRFGPSSLPERYNGLPESQVTSSNHPQIMLAVSNPDTKALQPILKHLAKAYQQAFRHNNITYSK